MTPETTSNTLRFIHYLSAYSEIHSFTEIALTVPMMMLHTPM